MKMPMTSALLAAFGSSTMGLKVSWTATVRKPDSSLVLLEDQPPLTMTSIDGDAPPALVIDRDETFQTIRGFGGAFTEASALNWKLLSPEDQVEVIRLYFAAPEEGGLGYTVGRVPINSCDFSPKSYTFDDHEGDVDLTHFDATVAHDVDSGMVPMIKAALKTVRDRGAELQLLASPWSPPAWMKVPVPVDWDDREQSMVRSAKPNGLLPSMQRPWANYFSRWISAYENLGIPIWAVTVQVRIACGVRQRVAKASTRSHSLTRAFVPSAGSRTSPRRLPDGSRCCGRRASCR